MIELLLGGVLRRPVLAGVATGTGGERNPPVQGMEA